MNIADRIQYLRKTNGMSQEELADKVGVSRQAVSKWESEQSTPDLDKIILMSEIFEVTTDYILKGIDPIKGKEQKNKEGIGKVLFITSTLFIIIGLFCAIAGWYEEQTMRVVWQSLLFQAIGVAIYFIAIIVFLEKALWYVKWFNVMGLTFIPVSIVSGYLSIFLFRQGWISPYPIGIMHMLVFASLYFVVCLIAYIYAKKHKVES